MTPQRLDAILARLPQVAIVVLGDYFLDRYFEIDPALAETSLETGRQAHQVVSTRCHPGAAGTIVANLCALGVGGVLCVGFLGDDGEGFELLRALRAMGAQTDALLVRPDRATPTYRKPLLRLPDGGLRELERLDTKNRRPTPADLEDHLLSHLRALVPAADAIIAQDQVEEAECGAVTSRLRDTLAELAAANPQKVWFGDSRLRVGEYRNLILKPNRREACRAIHPDSPAHDSRQAHHCAAALSARVGRPVYLTLGAEGISLVTPEQAQPLPAVPLAGPLDTVGAGDSATAGLVSALSAGADPLEAAIVGNLVASITVQQIRATGTATQEQVRAQFARHAKLWRTLPPPLPLTRR